MKLEITKITGEHIEQIEEDR